MNIGELAKLVKATMGYEGDIVFDHSKPDGTIFGFGLATQHILRGHRNDLPVV